MTLLRAAPAENDDASPFKYVFPNEDNESHSEAALHYLHTLGEKNCKACHDVNSLEELQGSFSSRFQEFLQIHGRDFPEKHGDISGVMRGRQTEVLASPVVRTAIGKPAKIAIGGGDFVQFLVRGSDERFSLHTIPDESRIELTIRPQGVFDAGDENASERVFFSVDLKVTQLVRREEIAWISLPVGRPVFNSNGVEAVFERTLGQTAALVLNLADGSDAIVLVRIRDPMPAN